MTRKQQEVSRLYKQGLSPKEIGVRLGISGDAVTNIRRKIGIKANQRSPRKVLENGQIVCELCGEPKPIRSFGSGSKCGSCRTKERNKRFGSTKEQYFALCVIKKRATSKQSGVAFNLTAEFLIKLYDHFAGKCFYTDEEMSIRLGDGYNPLSLSIDRIEYDKGYVEGNVVLCTRRANVIKSNMSLGELEKWMPGWFERIRRFKNL